MTDYEALKAYGFSAAKAAEIELDANRGDSYAQSVLRLATVSKAKSSLLVGKVTEPAPRPLVDYNGCC